MADSTVVRLTSEAELRAIHTETFVNTTQAVTKVSDNSVLAGVIAGNAKTAKKALKDISLATSHLFPDTAFGSTLDTVAQNNGISARQGSSQSSVYVRVVGAVGTVYSAGVNTVSGKNGITFDLQETLTLGVAGYGYIKCRSQQAGDITNVGPYTITTISPIPVGHTALINEYVALGGRDAESDDVFRQRIKNGGDILSRGTLSYLTQAFIKTNSNVLNVVFQGISTTGLIILGVVSQNGIDFTSTELNLILQNSSQYLSLTELNPIGTNIVGVVLQNVAYQYIDVNFRMSILSGYVFGDVVKDIQIKLSKLVDFRFWDSSKTKVSWTDLLNAAKNVRGVQYIPDTNFVPSSDITISTVLLPRFRSFQVYDLNGNLIINETGTITPILYPNAPDTSFGLTVL